MQTVVPVLFGVLVLFAGYCVKKYWDIRLVKTRQEHALLEGWTKITVKIGDEVWVCPRCALPSYHWNFAEQHEDPEQSACAWLRDNGEDLESVLKLFRANRDKAGDGAEPGVTYEYSASAVYDPGPESPPEPVESDPELAEIDAMEDRGKRFRAIMDRNRP